MRTICDECLRANPTHWPACSKAAPSLRPLASALAERNKSFADDLRDLARRIEAGEWLDIDYERRIERRPGTYFSWQDYYYTRRGEVVGETVSISLGRRRATQVESTGEEG